MGYCPLKVFYRILGKLNGITGQQKSIQLIVWESPDEIRAERANFVYYDTLKRFDEVLENVAPDNVYFGR